MSEEKITKFNSNEKDNYSLRRFKRNISSSSTDENDIKYYKNNDKNNGRIGKEVVIEVTNKIPINDDYKYSGKRKLYTSNKDIYMRVKKTVNNDSNKEDSTNIKSPLFRQKYLSRKMQASP